MSMVEFNDWCAYMQLEPFGPIADWFRFAQLMVATVNPNRGKGTPAFKARDFMPEGLFEQKRPQTLEEQEAVLLSIVQAFGGKDRRKKKNKKK